MPDTVGSEQHEPTSLRGIAPRAKACKHHRFRDLYRELNAGFLLSCWRSLNKAAASGVDEVTAQAYQENLVANIKGFFDHMDHDWLLGMLKQRIDDRAFVSLIGHYNYYGLRGNSRSLYRFYQWSIECVFKWLNRKGGKRRSFTWASFAQALKRVGVAVPRITEKQRQHVVFA